MLVIQAYIEGRTLSDSRKPFSPIIKCPWKQPVGCQESDVMRKPMGVAPLLAWRRRTTLFCPEYPSEHDINQLFSCLA